MNRILVIADGGSDLLQLLTAHLPATVIPPCAVAVDDTAYDALCILGGTGEGALRLPAPQQALLGRMRAAGKPVFCEFLSPLGRFAGGAAAETVRRRMVYRSGILPADGLTDGDLLDGQAGECLAYEEKAEGARPILSFVESVCAHRHTAPDSAAHTAGQWALFFMDETTLVSAIRLSNFRRARFAPARHWEALITAILTFLAGEAVHPVMPLRPIRYRETVITSAAEAEPAIHRGLGWIRTAGILRDGGESGAHEGFFHRISARDGAPSPNFSVRTDCTGEIGGAILHHAILTGDSEERAVADSMFDYIFNWLMVKEGAHRGMLRWHEGAWEWCFQDDAARAILPLLLLPHLGCEIPHLGEICEALDYMVNTTGEDGLRSSCTRIHTMTPEYTASLRRAGSGTPCAHFNAYYHAALLLAYRATGREEYRRVAERGLSTIMVAYPQTRRETSETEENCRLVFPLAVLYGVTKSPEHYEWLVRVTEALAERRHPSGGYAEWDSGYTAFCSRNHSGECALLAENGDPVADLLYSNNWLPLGFAYAYLVTGEERFRELWCGIASFLASAQIESDDGRLDGAWARAFDMDERENFGMPHDVGWGPCCIESGWTVGEILMGLTWMQVAEQAHKKEK